MKATYLLFFFTFECDTAGIFEITAIAYDNLNASATSPPVTISLNLRHAYPELLNLYPTPNNGNFTVDINPLPETYSELSLSIVSLAGKTVYSAILTSGETTARIKMNESLPGIYILKIANGNMTLTTRRFIKY